MTTSEKLELIDQFLEEPNNNDPRWVEMMKEYRLMLVTEQKRIEHNRAKSEEGPSSAEEFVAGMNRLRRAGYAQYLAGYEKNQFKRR